MISNRVDTEKALESQDRGIPAVRPEWIYECCRKWQLIEVQPFVLQILGKRRKRNFTETVENDEDFENEKDFSYDDNEKVILNANDLEEIQRELADLDDESDESDDETENESVNELDSNSEIDSDEEEDFSDLLNYSSSSSSSSSS